MINKVIQTIENEKKCVERQIDQSCPRFYGNTCADCDLCLSDTQILTSYDYVLAMLYAERNK